MTKLAGSCQCGSITFTSELEPMFVNQCNCERCRKMFGVVQASAIFADHEVEFNGELSIYTFEGGSGGKIHAYFCSICATKTHFYADALDGLVGIVLGTIDDNHKYPPNSEIFTNYKLNWLKDDGCITESFEEAAVYERLEKVIKSLEDRDIL